MKKGTKRKASQKDESKPSSQDNNNKETDKKPTRTRAKLVKSSKPESEPEYCEDQRNMVVSLNFPIFLLI